MSGAVPGNAGRDDYPKMLYHPDGRTQIAATAEEHNALLPDGWAQTPFAVHTRPKPSPSITTSGNDPLAVLIRETLERVLDERGIGGRPGADKPPPPKAKGGRDG